MQSIYDTVLRRVKRGHDNATTILATQMLKDSFLKVGYHAMLGLPETTRDMDVHMFTSFFTNQDYTPDALKIYPCLVFKGTPLYDEWRNKTFTPITMSQAAETIAAFKPSIAPWCRVMRVQRDIPSTLVEDGVDKTNLRQYVHELMKEKNIVCRCIRCREPMKKKVDWDAARLARINYDSSGGQEIFLSYEDTKNDILLGFCRLRKPYQPYRKEITERSMGIREIHVYGPAIGIGEKSTKEVQHKGIGYMLMEEAEKIAVEEYDAKKMLVISGIGVREWFKKKLRYTQDGPYVSKLF